MKTLAAVLLAVGLAAPLRAQLPECASSPEIDEFQRELGILSEIRARQIAAKGLPAATASVVDNVMVVNADETNSPFRRPFDLSGRSLIFTRTGSTGYRMENVALAWEEMGSEVPPVVAEERYIEIDLGFDFPFYDGTVRRVYASAHNAIFFSRPRASTLQQWGETDAAAATEPVIAPLWSTSASQRTRPPTFRVRKASDRVTITWSVSDQYAVQAVLHRSGDIVFSYDSMSPLASTGAILITSGTEAWRSVKTPIVSAVDATEDTPSSLPNTLAPVLDLTAVSMSRVSGLDLYEVRLTTRGRVTPAGVPNETLRYYVIIGENGATLRYTQWSDGTSTYELPFWGEASGVRFEGNDLVLPVAGELLPLGSSVIARAFTYRGTSLADSVTTQTAPLGAPAQLVRTDFSTTAEKTFDGVPIAEVFTLPILSVNRVWQQVKAVNPLLSDAAIDGVAIYQNFYTDLITYAGAYSTGGNSASSGIAVNDGIRTTQPRTPALMHMNKILYGHNSTSPGASRVVMHELGHRWLLRVTIDENGVRTRVLDPVSSHPAQYVDTRAVQRVYTARDTSVMGGGWFTDNANGTFTTSTSAAYGYSWLDLYLMGLAAPSEVPPFFYLANSDPALGGEYYAPSNQTYRATRRDVTVDQVITGTGPRIPAYPDTQRTFRVVFVLLADPSRPFTAEELAEVQKYRGLMEADFRTATLGRGEIVTTVETPEPPPAGPRRRAVRR